MRIIPAINCQDFECVKDKLQKTAEFGAGWAQIDIADGKFTKHKTWDNPEEFKILNLKFKINVEVHLMVENPLDVMNEWIEAGAKRIIVHIESIEISNLKSQNSKLNLKNIEIGLALNPNTPVENLLSYLATIDDSKQFVQLLAVEPGLSGQKFQPQILEKIKFLKKNYSNVIIEVDGGINPETAKMCKEAGADILVVGSYIWESNNSLGAYKELAAI
ncbi:MAG: ribulose-phosphate 3-epimerase [Patescibacteria group bacterium]|nr:ribulose-phosphate 3-epimerase [Patescibacteria group bacterium]